MTAPGMLLTENEIALAGRATPAKASEISETPDPFFPFLTPLHHLTVGREKWVRQVKAR